MYNPCHLIKSRHDIFYFRYPIGNKRISISLKTRCPKEALRLAKVLDYHSADFIKAMDWESMDHADIIAMLKNYFSEVLEGAQNRINKNGPLPHQNVAVLQNSLKEWKEVIAAKDCDDFMELMGAEYEDPTYDPLKAGLQKVMAHNGLSFAEGSKEYGMLKSAYKYAKQSYIQDLLDYNHSITNFSLRKDVPNNAVNTKIKSQHTLGKVMEAYLDEIKTNLAKRSYDEQSDCLYYLIDWLGSDYQIAKLDVAKAREAKELLRSTPNSRNKAALTKEQPLLKQITIAQEHKLTTLSTTSINKYLGYFGSLFNWAKDNQYISDNPFGGMRVKAEKKKARRRELFSKEEINKIIAHLPATSLV